MNGAVKAEQASCPPWRGVIALVLAVLWLGGLGSLLAVGLAWHWLRQGHRAPPEGRLLRVALWIGLVGLILTIVVYGLLISARSS
ncbi:MAG: hypothetical protein JWN46_1173 [Acidimicrobiales bacterium]|nr:hypothetical protein [Acidimicrobiales bacterium]